MVGVTTMIGEKMGAQGTIDAHDRRTKDPETRGNAMTTAKVSNNALENAADNTIPMLILDVREDRLLLMKVPSPLMSPDLATH